VAQEDLPPEVADINFNLIEAGNEGPNLDHIL
jgi:hypothetical protein